jgi:hypothetical protein
MLCQRSTKTTAFMAVLALAGCGSSGSIDVVPVFAGDAPITGADFISRTFPFPYIARNPDTDTLERKTGSIRVLSFNQFELITDDVREIITETTDGSYIGATINAESFFFSPGIGAINAQDAFKTYSGLFGFETPASQLPRDVVVTYTAPTGARLFTRGFLVENPDVAFPTDMVGDVELSVDFETGAVAGSLFTSDAARVDIREGTVSENGISGDLEFFLILGGLPFSFEESSGDVTGHFYGPAASGLAGTFEGSSGNSGVAPSTEFVGTFVGLETPAPD